MAGEVFHLWVSPVPYFRRIKHNRLVKIKVQRGVAQTLNRSIVRIFDESIFEEADKATQKQLQIRQDVPSGLGDAWKNIRQHPENYTIWGSYFAKRWRTPQGISGRWVYVYSLFSLEEMTKRLGRRKLLQGVLLEKPLSVHTPPTKEQWVTQRVSEDRAKRLEITRDRMRAYEKEYRRIVKEKWLNLVFHPTVTILKESEIMDRLSGFENIMAITAHSMNVLGSDLAKYKALAHFAEGTEESQRKLINELHGTIDRLGDLTQIIEVLRRASLEKVTPIIISTEAPWPSGFPLAKVAEPPKPSRWKAPLPENFWTYITMFAGFFMMFSGALLYVSNPSLWGVMCFGVLLFMFGVFLYWRESKKIKVPETIKEETKKVAEVVKGE